MALRRPNSARRDQSTLRNAAVARGFERCSHITWRRLDWLADDAVSCEPVSTTKFLANREINREFSKSGGPSRLSCLINARTQWLTAEFPAQRNREFSNAYQGIFFEEQGIFTRNAEDALILILNSHDRCCHVNSVWKASGIVQGALHANHDALEFLCRVGSQIFNRFTPVFHCRCDAASRATRRATE